MSKEVIFILAKVSMAMWITMSREAVKPSDKLAENDNIMSAGTQSALVITITLFQSLPLYD
ncbi:hypothetical protein ACWV26_07350 [Rummeliibacillus sp. JY-2-4R]